MTEKIKPANPSRGSVPDDIVQHLRGRILSGELSAGTRLPTEHGLCRQFAASRPAVREALSRLKHDGLVETRRGAGAFVSHPGRLRSFHLDVSADGVHDELRQIFELRLVFETASARLAAMRRTAAQLENIDDALRAMEAVIDSGGDAVPADTRFHRAIAEAAGNKYMTEMMAFLESHLRASVEASRRELRLDSERARNVHREHEAIHAAIAAGDGERARAAMLLHLSIAGEELGLLPREPWQPPSVAGYGLGGNNMSDKSTQS